MHMVSMKKASRSLLIPRLLPLILLLAGCAQRQALLLDSLGGLPRAGKVETYDTVRIFDYMDGAAEKYIDYNLRQMTLAKYGPKGEILIELYDMGRACEAKELLTHEFPGPDAGVGQASRLYEDKTLVLQQGPFIANITIPEADGDKAKLLAVGKELVALIPPADATPPIFAALPRQDLDPKTIRYFHTDVSLNRIHYVADENVLCLSPKTECAFAEYALAGDRVKLFLIEYPNASTRAKAWQKFCQDAFKTIPPSPTFIGKDYGKKLVAVSMIEKDTRPLLAVCFGAQREETCRMLLSRMGGRP